MPKSLGNLKVFSVEKLMKPLSNLVNSPGVPLREEMLRLRAICRVSLSLQGQWLKEISSVDRTWLLHAF